MSKARQGAAPRRVWRRAPLEGACVQATFAPNCNILIQLGFDAMGRPLHPLPIQYERACLQNGLVRGGRDRPGGTRPGGGQFTVFYFGFIG